MESSMSPADFAAITGNENFGGGAWWIILLFLFAMGGGNFGFGGNSAATQEILYGQQFQGLSQKMDNLGNGIADATFALNNSITNEGRSLQSQISNCCCEITNAVHSEAEATRQLMQENTIQALRDKIYALETDTRLAGVVRYPMSMVYSNTNNPFCGGYSCGNAY